ncbi:hypothetical protein AVEN_208588-1 [Araneus ventricosus]|uniref:Uncharacterized protein n=1 Tax=Araneus ventricosus TaxID=182803 RepID=A0A4Y2GCT3_ARAVE|nr:hypothetical protein AVEN_139954-1 [Araneus ventricosus]GBM51403.1 hypothetical protein AVEN_208588-1 [Araneus ventricosus]
MSLLVLNCLSKRHISVFTLLYCSLDLSACDSFLRMKDLFKRQLFLSSEVQRRRHWWMIQEEASNPHLLPFTNIIIPLICLHVIVFCGSRICLRGNDSQVLKKCSDKGSGG